MIKIMVKKKDKLSIPFLVLYYFLIINIADLKTFSASMIFLYIQLPIVIFSFYSIVKNKFVLTKENVNFIIYLLLISLINIIRNETNLILSTLVDVLPIIFIISGKKHSLNIKTFNYLYIFQILLAIFQFSIGDNLYGVVPFLGNVPSFEWKISLFAYLTPPFTAAFSFIIFFLNRESNTKKNKISILVQILCLYFIIFSGSRTIYLLLGFYFIFKLIKNKISFPKNPFFYILFPLLVFYISLSGGEIIKNNIGGNNIIGEMLFRDNQGGSNFERSDRYVMWNNYLDVFYNNFIIGKGYFDPRELILDSPGSSETLIPLLLAYHGVFYVIFLFAIGKLLVTAIKKNNYMSYLSIITFLVLCSFYGSYMRGYNLVYIMLFYIYSNNQIDTNFKGNKIHQKKK